MKVVILAGGYGSRLSEYTEVIPKPMVRIGNIPIIIHIMKHYASYGHKEFFLALGYKSELIKDYFLNLNRYNSDLTIDYENDEIKIHNKKDFDWKVTLVETGLKSMTGGRLKRIKKYVKDETFLMTYGDGVSDINLDHLYSYHRKQNKLVTVTIVRPVSRFGEINLVEDKINSFIEKPSSSKGWINGGFFVIEPGFLDYIKNDSTVLEKEPLEKVAKEGNLIAYKHNSFWQCMDTKRDKEMLESLWNKKRKFS